MAVADISGIRIPDSRLAREASEFIRETESTLLFDHSTRVYLLGAMAGHRTGVNFDPELLYTAAMFHDVGLTAGFRKSKLRFEVDGANAVRQFFIAHDVLEEQVAGCMARHRSASRRHPAHGSRSCSTLHGRQSFAPRTQFGMANAYPFKASMPNSKAD